LDKFFHVSSFGENTEMVLQDCLQQLANCRTDANLGFLYVSDVIADSLNDILHHCQITSGVSNWVGSLGIGIITNDKEIYDQPAISILLCQFEDSQFNILEPTTSSDELLSNIRVPENSESCFAFIHVDGYHEDPQALINLMSEDIKDCFIAGGYTSSRSKQLQIANQITSNCLSGVLFSDKIPVITNLTQGCTPVGDKHRITQAEKNVVFSLDHKPALDVFYDDIGEVLSRDIEKASSYIFAGLCISESDKNDYMVRTLVGVDDNKRVFAINDYLIEGDDLLFCRRDGNAASEDMQHMLQNIKKRLTRAPKGGIYVSCLGRGREQFGEDSEEIKMIHDILGDFPLTGFFANGEIHHNRVYGYTGVLTLFV
jgi:small ligand-binding sensory domain FIST